MQAVAESLTALTVVGAVGALGGPDIQGGGVQAQAPAHERLVHPLRQPDDPLDYLLDKAAETVGGLIGQLTWSRSAVAWALKGRPRSPSVHTGGVGSKYDDYWAGQLPQIRAQVQVAASGGQAAVSVPDLTRLGARQSWHGMAEVRAQEMVCSSGAHATSLGRTVAASCICRAVARTRLPVHHRCRRRRAHHHGHHGRGSSPPGSPGNRARRPARASATRGQAASARQLNHPDLATPTAGGDRQSDAGEFYRILDQLSARLGGPRRLRECTGSSGCPPQGIYFFFEDGENRADGSRRLVRIGTHALTQTSKATLWGGLRQHRGQLAGRDPGGGDHRALVFRRHVGAALIRRDGLPDDLLASWLDRHRPPGRARQPGSRHRTRGQPPHRGHAVLVAQRSRQRRPRLPREQQHRAAVLPRRRTRPARRQLARPPRR